MSATHPTPASTGDFDRLVETAAAVWPNSFTIVVPKLDEDTIALLGEKGLQCRYYTPQCPYSRPPTYRYTVTQDEATAKREDMIREFYRVVRRGAAIRPQSLVESDSVRSRTDSVRPNFVRCEAHGSAAKADTFKIGLQELDEDTTALLSRQGLTCRRGERRLGRLDRPPPHRYLYTVTQTADVNVT